VTRVSSHRLPLARDVRDYLDGIDEEVLPIVLGKEAVYRSVVGRYDDEPEVEALAGDADTMDMLAEDAQTDLDHTVHCISSAFRVLLLDDSSRSNLVLDEEEADSPSHQRVVQSGNSLDFAFPPELADSLHRLYHLRRSPMLSPGPLRGVDDRAQLRNLFLRLPLDDCLCMMAPSLWSIQVGTPGTTPTLEPIPSDTLTLWDNRIIAADHHDGLFVWSGKATLDTQYDGIRQHCQDFLLDRSKLRFPQPQLHVVHEGESMSRRFTTRLAPTHADPWDRVVVHFPALQSLTPMEKTSLLQKFVFHDEQSDDVSFRRWFWSVASAGSPAAQQGMSLCQ